MAHIELGYRVAAVRPSAPYNPSRAREIAQTPRLAPARPKFCRVDAGQLVRTALLVLLCLGLSQLPRVEKISAGSIPAVQPKV